MNKLKWLVIFYQNFGCFFWLGSVIGGGSDRFGEAAVIGWNADGARRQ